MRTTTRVPNASSPPPKPAAASPKPWQEGRAFNPPDPYSTVEREEERSRKLVNMLSRNAKDPLHHPVDGYMLHLARRREGR